MAESRGSVKHGGCLGLLLVAVASVIVFLLALTSPYHGWMYDHHEDQLGWLVLCFQPGFTQLPIVLPAAIVIWRRGQTETLKGLCIAAGVLFLLNAACWGLMMG